MTHGEQFSEFEFKAQTDSSSSHGFQDVWKSSSIAAFDAE